MARLFQNPIEAPDYQLIAENYDQRFRSGDIGELEPVIQDFMKRSIGGRWLEVGCGTGRWLLDPADGISVLGLDQSRAMLTKASEKLMGVPLVRAEASFLPFQPQCFRAIAVVHALHHFPDQDRFIQQALQRLVTGGGLLVIGMNAHAEGLDWYIYDFFEGTAERDRARFLDPSVLAKRLLELGFSHVDRGLASLIDDRQIGEAVLHQPFLQRRGCSQLALLTDGQYERGLARVKAAIAEDPSFEFRAHVPLEFLWASK